MVSFTLIMEKIGQHLSDNQVATQRNDLLRGQQSFSLVQKRIFALAIQQIKRGDQKLKPYTIEIQDLVNTGTSRKIFSQVEKEADGLMDKKLLKKEQLPNSDYPKTTRWNMIMKATHNPGEGTLTIRINPEIKEMLIKLKEQGNFTPVPVAEMLACRSSYGQRIYELLYSQRWKKTGKWEVSVEDLRFALDIETKYKNFSDLRRRVLEKAQKDLKEHTNMRFDFETESREKGRKITHVIFDFSFILDQMDLALEVPENKPKFDIYNLRNRLKTYAKLEQKKINKILGFLENNSDVREEFKQQYHHVEANIQQGTDDQGRAINSDSGYAWSEIKPLIES